MNCVNLTFFRSPNFVFFYFFLEIIFKDGNVQVFWMKSNDPVMYDAFVIVPIPENWALSYLVKL